MQFKFFRWLDQVGLLGFTLVFVSLTPKLVHAKELEVGENAPDTMLPQQNSTALVEKEENSEEPQEALDDLWNETQQQIEARWKRELIPARVFEDWRKWTTSRDYNKTIYSK